MWPPRWPRVDSLAASSEAARRVGPSRALTHVPRGTRSAQGYIALQ
jgi:hypothetical protein